MLNFGDREKEIRELERELSINMVLLDRPKECDGTNAQIQREIDRIKDKLASLYYGY